MKIFKRVITAVLLLVMSFSLVGCDFIDELRNSRAYLKDDGTIEYNGNVFINYTGDLSDYFYVEYNENKPMFDVADDDKPLLVAYFENAMWLSDSINKDETIIETENNDGQYVYYLREDMYDIILEDVVNIENEYTLRFNYYDYDDDEYREYILDESAVQAIELALMQSPIYDNSEEYYRELYLNKYSKLGYGYTYYDYSVVEKDGGYYVISYDYSELYPIPSYATSMFKEYMDIYNE